MTCPPKRAVFGIGPNEDLGLTYIFPVIVKSPQNCNLLTSRKNKLPFILISQGKTYFRMFCRYRFPLTSLMFFNSAPELRLSIMVSPINVLFSFAVCFLTICNSFLLTGTTLSTVCFFVPVFVFLDNGNLIIFGEDWSVIITWGLINLDAGVIITCVRLCSIKSIISILNKVIMATNNAVFVKPTISILQTHFQKARASFANLRNGQDITCQIIPQIFFIFFVKFVFFCTLFF